MSLFKKQHRAGTAQFQYSTLPENGIRLVTFTEDGISLSVYTRHHAPEYHALSYACGKEPKPPTHFVSCRDPDRGIEGTLAVTPNLSEALQYVRYMSVPIWIDAICIKQTSNEEKETLVPRMNEIYENAKKVIIWLGPHRQNSELAMAFLKAICMPVIHPITVDEDSASLSVRQIEATREVLLGDVAIDIDPVSFARLGLPRFGHPVWTALSDLFVRPWTTRIWTFQEGMMAKYAMVFCGTSWLEWTYFVDMASRLIRTQLFYQTISRIPPYLAAYEIPKDDTGKFFLLYLITCRTRFCSLREDRVYALLSLASHSIRAEIAVKYSDDKNKNHYQSVYHQVGRALIKQISLYPLDVILAAATSHGKPTGIPSWCPDWSLPGKSTPAGPKPRAGYPLEHMESCTAHPKRLHSILVQGACVDRIQYVISDYAWNYPDDDITGIDGHADILLEWLRLCWRLTRKVTATDLAWIAYWETIFAHIKDRVPNDFPHSPEAGLRALMKQLAEARDCIPPEQTKLDSTELAALTTVVGFLERIWKGRVFFSTKGGRVGYADEGVMKDDMVCVFFGEPYLYILRPRTTPRYADGNEMEFCSRSFVHGLMMGEACMPLRQEDVKMFEIT